MKRTTLIATPLIALALALPAAAEMQDNQNRQSQQAGSQYKQQQQQQQQQQRQIRISGELIDFRTVKLQGQKDKHMLGKVRMDSGDTVVIDLGPAKRLKQQNFKLRKGQQAQVTGRPGRINDRPIVIVDRYVGDGQFTLIVPAATLASQSGQAHGSGEGQVMAMPTPRQRAQRGSPVHAFGKLVDLQEVDLNKVPDPHRLAKLQLSGGRTVIVDLGTDEQLQDISLKKGEYVMIRGALGRINGKPVVFATTVADVVQIDRQQQSSPSQSN